MSMRQHNDSAASVTKMLSRTIQNHAVNFRNNFQSRHLNWLDWRCSNYVVKIASDWLE